MANPNDKQEGVQPSSNWAEAAMAGADREDFEKERGRLSGALDPDASKAEKAYDLDAALKEIEDEEVYVPSDDEVVAGGWAEAAMAGVDREDFARQRSELGKSETEKTKDRIESETKESKARYEEARREFVDAADSPEGDSGEIKRARKRYLNAMKEYVLHSVAVLDRELPKKDGKRSPQDAQAYEAHIGELFHATYRIDSREKTLRRQGAPGKHMDVLRELVRDQEMYELFKFQLVHTENSTEGISYTYSPRLRTLVEALQDSPADQRILGEVDPGLESAKQKFREARFAYLNAYYDWKVDSTLQNAARQEKALAAYEKAREKVAKEFKKKPEDAEGVMDIATKEYILNQFYSDEKRHLEAIGAAFLSPAQKRALEKAKKNKAKIRKSLLSMLNNTPFKVAVAAVAAGVAIKTADIDGVPQLPTYRPALEDADEPPAEQQRPDNFDTAIYDDHGGELIEPADAGDLRDQVETGAAGVSGDGGPPPVDVDGGNESAPGGVIEVDVMSTGAVDTFEQLLRSADQQPWLLEWANESYENASLNVVDPQGIRNEPGGREKIMAEIMAQTLRMHYYSVNTDYSARLPEGTVYANSGGVFLAPEGGGVHIALLRNTVRGVQPVEWEGGVTERRRYKP